MISLTVRELLLKMICFIIVCLCIMPKSSDMKKQYFSLEHPKTSVVHPQYFQNVVFKSRRKSRANPIHYVDVNITNLQALDKHYKVSASFYQLLSNVYKPSFVELNMSLCDAFKSDILITPAFIDAFNRLPQESRPIPELKCPILPGNYSFTNMMMPTNNIPAGFPFKEGRIIFKMARGTTIVLGLQIDFQLLILDL